MEVHAQVASNAKLFSGASTRFGAEPNSNVAFVDAAMPGMLPVINEFCVEQAVRTGLGLKAQINLWSAFDRKNYFYPDLPQGYQISQLYHPLVGEGEILVDMEPGIARLVRIERIHMEQDAGKSIHDMDPAMSFVDLNRTGVCLMEIVSRPDIRGPEEAAAYVTKLRQILRYLGTCDGNMQNGNLRADVNVSVCRPGQYEKYMESQDFAHLGTRCEIKNMNSMRFIQMAIDYEARRQIAIVESGGEVVQETRLYDPDRNETRSMRSKEEAHDYRYFPDPDLLPLEIEQEWVDGIEANLPELPDAKKARFVLEFGLSEYDASVLTAEVWIAHYFEDSLKELQMKSGTAANNKKAGKQMANWIINEVFGKLTKHFGSKNTIDAVQSGILSYDSTATLPSGDVVHYSSFSPSANAEIVEMTSSDEISGKIAKEVFEISFFNGGTPREVVAREGLKQVTDTGAIEQAVDEIIAANPAQVEKAQANPKLAGWFVGQVMKATGGKANPKAVNEIVTARLGL
ncbi:Asp-tRNA(Asn)/Glu-tRNA(Gln) amidotransferase subunit GatB [Roseovarius ramblicola]|uniref:Aspartyl/glutamyl-tRNA(Asn/Gln) amidotransferase subunit B n=1 Tax=Roseovarius ramblicola TaxID=2022336 RepID=A0ABV5HYJ3_9RHOB